MKTSSISLRVMRRGKALPEARSKSGSVEAQKGQGGKGAGPAKGTPSKTGGKQVTKPSSVQKIQKQTPTKQAQLKAGKKGKKGQRGHQQYDLIVTLDLVEYGLSDDLVAEFKEAFMLIDKDEDGMITTGELGVVMRSLGQRPSEHELRKLVDGIETCADGTIEFNEFLQMMSRKLKTVDNEDELKEAFKVFDKKESGFLSTNELRNVMKSMGEKMTEEELEEMLKDASPSGDGKIDYDQFIRSIAKKH